MTGEPFVLGADQLCKAVETVLTEKVPVLLELLERGDLGVIKTWQQLPTIEALSAAQFPAAAITSPGLSGTPIYSRASNSWTATWRIAVGVYDRGKDHAETAAHVRDWCAIFRTVLLLNKRLGGIAKNLTWVGEEYARIPRKEQARTIGAGAVAVDVTVDNVADFDGLTEQNLPLVLSTNPTLTVQPPGYGQNEE